MLFTLQRWVIWPGTRTPTDERISGQLPGLEKLWLNTDEGRVEAWLLPGKGVSATTPGPAVIAAHGNAELIEYMAPLMTGWQELGFSVLLPEYRGFGRSAGSPSQEAVTADYVAFYDLLAARPDVDKHSIIFHGRSLGGGVACALAAERTPAALVLQSTFTSVTRMARGYLLPSMFVRDPFDNLSVLRSLAVPVLLVHGRHDSMIPFEHSEDLAAAAANATLVPYDADHNDCPPVWSAFWSDVEAFLTDNNLR